MATKEKFHLSLEDETEEEKLRNNLWVDELQGYKLITIPNRQENGMVDPVRPTIQVKVIWKCPVCGMRLGEPHLITLSEGRIDYTVSAWDNPCGHQSFYNQLQAAPGWELPDFYNK